MAEPDEFALRRDLERASRAQALIDNALLGECFDTLEKSYFEAWKRSKPSEDVARERLHAACTIIGAVREQLMHVISDGTVAKQHLALIEGQKKRNA